MANRDFRKIERIMKDFSMGVGEGGSSNGGGMIIDLEKLEGDTIYLDTPGFDAKKIYNHLINGGFIMTKRLIPEKENTYVYDYAIGFATFKEDDVDNAIIDFYNGERINISLRNYYSPAPKTISGQKFIDYISNLPGPISNMGTIVEQDYEPIQTFVSFLSTNASEYLNDSISGEFFSMLDGMVKMELSDPETLVIISTNKDGQTNTQNETLNEEIHTLGQFIDYVNREGIVLVSSFRFNPTVLDVFDASHEYSTDIVLTSNGSAKNISTLARQWTLTNVIWTSSSM